jgi:hypothetical protein
MEKTLRFFASLSPEQWEQQVYDAGPAWNVHHILAHFVSSERAFLWVIHDILKGGSGVPIGFDINAFNEREVAKLAQEPRQTLVDSFKKYRADVIKSIESMQEEDLTRIGYHPWFGKTALGKMLKLVYRHNMIHLREIRAVLKENAPSA